MNGKPTTRQQRFVVEYLVDLNAAQAAIRAGYSVIGANVRGSELLAKCNIQAAVQAAMDARAQRTEVTQDRVVAEFALIAFSDMRKNKHINMRDKLQALNCLAKHLGMYTAKIKIEGEIKHNHEMRTTEQLIDDLHAIRRRLAKEAEKN